MGTDFFPQKGCDAARATWRSIHQKVLQRGALVLDLRALVATRCTCIPTSHCSNHTMTCSKTKPHTDTQSAACHCLLLNTSTATNQPYPLNKGRGNTVNAGRAISSRTLFFFSQPSHVYKRNCSTVGIDATHTVTLARSTDGGSTYARHVSSRGV